MVEYALGDGYRVRAAVRDPSRYAGPAGVEVVQTDVLDARSVRRAVTGAAAVVSALGSDNFRAPGVTLSQGMRNIVAAMKAEGIRRVLAVGGSGVLDAPGGGLRSESPGFPEVFRAITAEHRGTWEALKESGLDWTLVCPPDIVAGERTSRFRELADRMPEGAKSISVEDVAGFLVRELGSPTYVGRRVGMAY